MPASGFTPQNIISPERSAAPREVSLDPAHVALLCAALLYAVSWIMGCSAAPGHAPGGGKKLASSRDFVKLASEDVDDKLVPTISGRKITIEKMAQRAATSLQYSNEEYGVAFDAPKGYLLKEGDLPEMDRGLGYLGPIPMHFAAPGGVRLATVEPPPGLHLGTNFVNDFFTVSAHYGASQGVCADFNIPAESRGAAVTRIVDGIEFHGFQENSAASMHQYSGIYLHAFANETCYEIGYGVATAGSAVSSNLKSINEENLLHKLERFLDNVRINPPDFERHTATD
jgi:hypothetical protein